MTKNEEKVLIAALNTERGKTAFKTAMLLNPIRSKQGHVSSEPTKESISKTLALVNSKLNNPQNWDEETLEACALMKPKFEKWLKDKI